MISIHALREEGDIGLLLNLATAARFLSTPSARRATDFHESQIFVIEISIHALREEGDRRARRNGRVRYISIHALREEGDG